MSIPKNFKEVEVGNYIFTLNPIEGTIIPLLVCERRNYQGKNPRLMSCIVIGYYILKPIPNVTLEKQVEIQKGEGKEIKVGHLITVPNLKIIHTQTSPPLIMAANEDEIQLWVKQQAILSHLY
jgi:hypothetical protein